jgi:glycosyltransferase involved in cell wall biosynthesis
MVIVEAMAMARPVLSTRVGIAPEVIEAGETGLLCSSPEPSALASGLREMLALRRSWPAISVAARRRVQTFTAASMGNVYRELYARWLGHLDSSRSWRRTAVFNGQSRGGGPGGYGGGR